MSRLRMLPGRVLLEQVMTMPSKNIFALLESRGSHGKQVEGREGKEIDAGQVRLNVGYVLSIRPEDSDEYQINEGDFVLYPQGSAHHPDWDTWERAALKADEECTIRPEQPRSWRCSVSDAIHLWARFGKFKKQEHATRVGEEEDVPWGVVAVFPVEYIRAVLPSGCPDPGEVS